MATEVVGTPARRSRAARYFLLHFGAGAALGAVVAGGLLLTDAVGLSRIISATGDDGAVAIFVLGGMMTIAPLVLATAIGLLYVADTGPTPGRGAAGDDSRAPDPAGRKEAALSHWGLCGSGSVVVSDTGRLRNRSGKGPLTCPSKSRRSSFIRRGGWPTGCFR